MLFYYLIVILFKQTLIKFIITAILYISYVYTHIFIYLTFMKKKKNKYIDCSVHYFLLIFLLFHLLIILN